MNKIYLAIPYSKVDHETSFNVANRESARLMRAGNIVFSPISHSHTMARDHDLPKGWEFWKAIDESFIRWCDEIHVVCMKMWSYSEGVQAEIDLALSLGKKINYIYVEE
jgi:hypothetical protein